MAKTEKYFVGPTLLGEIRDTISRVAGTPDKTVLSQPPVRLQELHRQVSNVRACSWTGTWDMGELQQIELTGATQTALAMNSYFGWREHGGVIGSGVVVKHSGAWHLHSIDLNTVQGITAIQTTAVGAAAYGVLGCEVIYDPNPPPGEASGAPGVFSYLRWFAVTACST